MSISRISAVFLAWGLLALLVGCDAGPLPSVRGKVTFRGQPLPRGTIVFTPDARRGSRGPGASAEITTDGSFSLRTGESEGAIPGWHRVTVIAVEDTVPDPSQRFSVPRSLLPEKYRDPDLSALACEVRPGRDNVINFNLE